ncbi:hypothetical protein OK015_00425 [Mycobacterium sp. Aquia_216]|uniref:hypothetical protein n=1 Tax=Mycobacterium sp. Aquia_216 TaxID=2991729 RepID=UPI00227ACB4B|nr:hypothetical protein [Mycobacterium sp. Aquia_216]WAJ45040.1 hypothetical protein OK015_00425 [Mycobacterium sp. Aquia_216]
MHVIFAGAATIAALSGLGVAVPGAAETAIAWGAGQLAGSGFAADDPSDPGWNADPGWDFQPSPEN